MTMVTICGRKFASAAILQATLLLLLLSAKNVAKEGLALPGATLTFGMNQESPA